MRKLAPPSRPPTRKAPHGARNSKPSRPSTTSSAASRPSSPNPKPRPNRSKPPPRAAAIRHAVETAAGSLSFQDPADALTLADLSTVQVADDGTVTGAAEAVKALADKRPYLLKPAGDALGTPRRQPAKTPPAEPAKPGAPLARL